MSIFTRSCLSAFRICKSVSQVNCRGFFFIKIDYLRATASLLILDSQNLYVYHRYISMELNNCYARTIEFRQATYNYVGLKFI